MIRRTFIKMLLATPLVGLIKPKNAEAFEPDKVIELEITADSTSDPDGQFWMQTYGSHYDPSSFGFDWIKADSSLLGIYHGEELNGVKAINCNIGDRMVLSDGRRYMCYGPNASSSGIVIKGKGVFSGGS